MHYSFFFMRLIIKTSSTTFQNNYNIDENIPKVLYGDDDNIKQVITYLIEFISNYFERYSLNVIISKLVVRNNCKLTFEFLVDYRCTDLELNEKK